MGELSYDRGRIRGIKLPRCKREHAWVVQHPASFFAGDATDCVAIRTPPKSNNFLIVAFDDTRYYGITSDIAVIRALECTASMLDTALFARDSHINPMTVL